MANNMGSHNRFLLTDTSESPTTPADEGLLDDDIYKRRASGIETASENGRKDDPDNTLSSAPAPTATFTDADVHRFLLQLPLAVLDKVKYHLLTRVHFKDIKRTGSVKPAGVGSSSPSTDHPVGPLHLPPGISRSGSGSGPDSDGPAERATGLGGGSSGGNSRPRPAAAELSAPPAPRAHPRQQPSAGVETLSPLSRALSTRFFGPPWNHAWLQHKPDDTAAGATTTTTTTATAESLRQRRYPALGPPPPRDGSGLSACSLRPFGPGVAAGGFLLGLPPPPVRQGPNPTADVDEKPGRGPQPQELEADVPASSSAAAVTAAATKRELILAQTSPWAAAPPRTSPFNVDVSPHTPGGEGIPRPGTPSSLSFGDGGDGIGPLDRGLAGGREDTVENGDDSEDDGTGSCASIYDEGRRHVSESELGLQSIGGEHAPASLPAPVSGAAKIAALERDMLKRRPLPSDYLARHRRRSRSHSRNRHNSSSNNNNHIGRRGAGTQAQGLVGFDLYRSLIGGARDPATEEKRGGDGAAGRDAQACQNVPPAHGGGGGGGANAEANPARDFLGLPPPRDATAAAAVSLPPSNSNIDTGNANGDDSEGDGGSSSHDGEEDEKEPELTDASAAAADSTQVDTQHAVQEWVGKVHGLAERTKELWYGLLDVQRGLAKITLEMEGAKVVLE
ncbi:hypothetical protein SLS62_008048 [Diatrype stigma]|uniref:Uncharacterized protein n=1 Tax=Diatrype stigma TaxID=117547 RepID=A0AAN9UPU6_9PEZI